MADVQSWTIPVTPAQRLLLFQLMSKLGEMKGQEARKFHRFVRAFGIDVIEAVIVEHGAGGGAIKNATTPKLHSITYENAECLRKLMDEAPRKRMVDVQLQPLWELLETFMLAKKEYTPNTELLLYGEGEAENWAPLKKPVKLDEVLDFLEETFTQHRDAIPETVASEMRSILARRTQTVTDKPSVQPS